MVPSAQAATGRVLALGVADREFGVAAEQVVEVRRVPALTRVPHGSPSLAGLMNYNGAAIAVVLMQNLLGAKAAEKPAAAGESRIVVFGDSPPVGLLVDRVLGLESGRATIDVAELLSRAFVATNVERVRLAAAEHVAPSATETGSPLLAFRVAGQRYALPLGATAEVLALPDGVTVLPRGAGSALGMLDYRGGVLPLLSVARLLGLADGTERAHVVVAMIGKTAVGLVVNELDGVVRVPKSAVEDVPAILQRGEGDAEIDAIARIGGDRPLIAILSPSKLIRNRDVAEAIDTAESGTTMSEPLRENENLQFVVFALGDESYGLPISSVEEVVQLPEILTRVPRAPAFVAGVMNLRGKALPVVDQRRRFGRGSSGEGGRVIVVTVGDMRAGFIVDAVSQVMRVPASAVAPAPQMPGDGVKVFDRIVPSGKTMVLIVDPHELLDRAERDMLSKLEGAATAS